MQGTGAAGNTITLSAGDAALNLTTKTLADNFTTDKNDTINAGTTWSANDKIDGGLAPTSSQQRSLLTLLFRQTV